jgi:hypothetical protein
VRNFKFKGIKMKKVFLGLFMAMSMMFSVGASAQVAVVHPAIVYSFEDVRSFEYSTVYNQLVFVYKNGFQQSIRGPGMPYYTALVSAVGGTTAASKFTQIDGTYKYVRTSFARGFFCTNGVTQINWEDKGFEDVADNCVLFNKVKASATINPMNY